jgi:hypothetical protein
VSKELIEAAQAVVGRWDTPLWKDAPATAIYIERLRRALAQPEPVEDPVRVVWNEINHKYNWVAMDADGVWVAYESTPSILGPLGTVWDSPGLYISVGGRAGCSEGTDWRTTLRKRPDPA